MSLDIYLSSPSQTSESLLPAQSSPVVVDLTTPKVHVTQAPTESDIAVGTYDVALVGLGYVGLPTALALHAAGCRVLGLEVSSRRLRAIRAGQADLLDSDRVRLTAALHERSGFTLTSDAAALSLATTIIIAVPTPVDEHLLPDLAILRAACDTVVSAARAGQTIILTSTTYVGCTRDFLVAPLARRGLRAGIDVHVAFSPERIDPGNASHAHEDVPRVVGGVTPACTQAASDLLSHYVASVHPVSCPEAAEITKLLENSYRAVNIAFINEFSDITRGFGLDISEVITAASTKPYGYTPFWPGAGVGGHCIPCDPHYLLWQLRRQRVSAPIMENTMRGIAQRPRQVVDRARQLLGACRVPMRDATVLVIGVAYKPDVEDVRESPALEVIEELIALGARVNYHDPLVDSIQLSDGHTLSSLPEPDAAGVDLVVIHTLHTGQELSWLPRTALVLDTTYRLSGETGRQVL